LRDRRRDEQECPVGIPGAGRVRDGGDAHDALRDIKRKLARDDGIEHAPVRIETGPCVD